MIVKKEVYSVWFCDLPKVIEVINEKLPNLATFCSIEGNAYGDFVVRNETDTWIVKHEDFSIWYLERTGKNSYKVRRIDRD